MSSTVRSSSPCGVSRRFKMSTCTRSCTRSHGRTAQISHQSSYMSASGREPHRRCEQGRTEETVMAAELKPIRRVVTGTDAQGRSRVLFDGPAPNVNPRAVSPGAGMTDVWVFERCPAVVSGERDDGNLPFNFE